MNAGLQSSIEGLYAAFADVPRPHGIGYCSHCRTEEQVEPLTRKPLREITPDDLGKYAFSAFNTMGDVPDFLYLLPRILEFLVPENRWWPDVEVVLPKLKEAGFAEWPESRRQALFRYLDAVFADLLEREKAGWEIDQWICARGRFLDDVSPWLDRLALHTAQVLAYYEQNCPGVMNGRLGNGFWDHDSAAYKQVVEWFNSPKIKAMTSELYGL
jgi:hypothetical protein